MAKTIHPRALRAIASAILTLEPLSEFTYEDIAHHAEYDTRTVALAVPLMIDQGVVIKRRVPSTKQGPHYHYRVVPERAQYPPLRLMLHAAA